jgi:hypothetical protein
MRLFTNAKFWNNGSFDNPIKAILCENGKIIEIYASTSDLPPNAEHFNLKGNYVFPGFIDTHTHSFEGGLYSLMIDLSAAQSLQDVFDLIESGANDKGKFIFAWNFDETKIKEARFPRRAELNQIVKDKNLVLRRVDGHSCVLNSYAYYNIHQAIPRFHSDDEILRALENDTAVHWFHNNLDNELILRSYHAASDIALKGGFSTIHTMVGDANMSIGHYSSLEERLDDFDVDFILYPQSFSLDQALAVGAKRIGGCILADGSIGSYTAAMYEPYKGKPIRGTLYQTDAFWQDFITRAHQNNLQVAVHCIGDRAIDQINKVYMSLANSDFKDLRHQLIHCELTDDALINQIKASGAVPVMQPMFDHLWGGDSGFYSRALGLERSKIMNRFGSFLSRGIKITGSSDWYITSLDIRQSLSAAIKHHNPLERLSPAQAIDIYTQNAAWLSHDENHRGKIEIGFDADFSILNYDPAHQVTDPKIVAVIKNQELVYINEKA